MNAINAIKLLERNIQNGDDFDKKFFNELNATILYVREKYPENLLELKAQRDELLEALENLVFHDESTDKREGIDNCIELQYAKQVIAKAKGE